MDKLWLLWLTMAVSIIFLVLPDSAVAYDFFPYSDMSLTFRWYTWLLAEKLVLVILSYIIYTESTKYKGALLVFFGTTVLKTVDYLLCYNEVWVYLWDGVPFTSNILSVLAFTLSIGYEYVYGTK